MATVLTKIKKSTISNIKGREVVSYAGKLDIAHQHGIQSLEAEILQFPNVSNNHTAICSATLVTKDGQTFKDIGDANPENVPPACVGSTIRMASTRAKARVLCDAFNIPSLDVEIQDMPRQYDPTGEVIDVTYQELSPPLALPVGVSSGGGSGNDNGSGNGGGSKPVSDKQLGLINRLCESHGHDPNALTVEMFGKCQTDLLGSEADRIIKRLKQ